MQSHCFKFPHDRCWTLEIVEGGDPSPLYSKYRFAVCLMYLTSCPRTTALTSSIFNLAVSVPRIIQSLRANISPRIYRQRGFCGEQMRISREGNLQSEPSPELDFCMRTITEVSDDGPAGFSNWGAKRKGGLSPYFVRMPPSAGKSGAVRVGC